MFLNSTIKGAPPDSTSTENEAEGGTGVGVGAGVVAPAAVGPLGVVGAGATVAAAARAVVGAGSCPPQAIARTIITVSTPERLQAIFTLSPLSVGEPAKDHEGLYARPLR